VPVVAGLFYGIKPAVTAIVVAAAWRIGSRVLTNAWRWAIAVAAFVAIFALELPFPLIVSAPGSPAGSAAVPADRFALGGGHGARRQAGGAALIDDQTPTPAHARFSWRRLAGSSPSASGSGSPPSAAWRCLRRGRGADADGLVLHQGRAPDLRRRLRGAALCLSGRGRAVPLAHWPADDRRSRARRDHAGSADHGGLVRRLRRRLDARDLRLGVASPRRGRGGHGGDFFTFLPSFFFIFAGGPFIESTHGKLGFTAPLTGITAAVVGVIVNLAVFFGYHVLWPAGLSGRFDALSA
jgi:chromate transporter